MKILFQTFLVIILLSTKLFAQPGTLDPSFNPGIGFDSSVYSISIQSDGKIIVGGQFTNFNGITMNRIARLNADGSLDGSFNPGSGFNDRVWTTSIQSDGKIIVGGDFTSFNGTTINRITRLNADGSRDVSFNPGTGFFVPGNTYASVRTTSIQSDGKIIVGGGFTSFNGTARRSIARLNANASLDATFNPGTGFDQAVYSISLQADGKIIVGGGFTIFNGTTINQIARLNTNGSLDATFNPGTGFTDPQILTGVYSISLQADGKIIVGGGFTIFNGTTINRIARLNTNGSLDATFNPGTGFNGLSVRSTNVQPDGKIIVGGSFTSFNGTGRRNIARLNSDGSLDASFNLGASFNPGTGFNNMTWPISMQSDGKIIVGGSFTSFNGTGRKRIARLKGDKGIYGKVYIDINENCLIDAGEAGLAVRNLIINPGNIIIQSQNNGYWFIDSLPVGTYTVTIDTSNRNWIPTCPITQTFTVVHPDSIVQELNFGFIAYPCPSPDISILMPRMRRGFNNQQIYVQACNEYTATGILDSAYTIVTLPSQITLQSASRTYTSLGNNRYRFYLGDINPGQCVNFTINATVTTQAVNGQTLCMNAELFPQADCVFDSIPTPYDDGPSGSVTPCTLPWDRSSLRVEGECVGDSVRFVIYNTGSFGGGDMDCFAPVRVYVDGQWVLLDSIRINGGDSVVFMFAGTGGTIRLEADQHPLHPGNSRPNANVENCGNGTWTPGIINTMPQDDADPIIDIYCGQVTAPYDPNDKTGFPLGVGTNHDIRQNQQIEYLIRFQNVGTDTAFNVVIRDTLTTDLNIFTVQSGVSSHPYEFRMYGPRVLEWKFNNIMLPDSNTNEPASNGFVKFTVEQNPDLPFGRVIENSAAIYFDFEAPVITNTYFHTIHDFSINVSVEPIEGTDRFVDFKVIPNPFSNTAQLKLEGLENTENLELEIFNLNGQRIQFLNNSQNGQFQLSRGEMSQGIYFLSVRQNGKVVARGKMVVE
jgi:uncharacterized delta-60 repeat protein/uncharacterized repeat protein (TIGR01451 family)